MDDLLQAGDIVGSWPSMHNAWAPFPAPHKPEVVQYSDASTCKMEAGEIQSSRSSTELEARLD